jgi:short-subunit dehydrogenase
LSPEYVASEVIHLIGKGSQSKIVGRSGIIMELISRLLPSHFLIRMWSFLMKSYR